MTDDARLEEFLGDIARGDPVLAERLRVDLRAAAERSAAEAELVMLAYEREIEVALDRAGLLADRGLIVRAHEAEIEDGLAALGFLPEPSERLASFRERQRQANAFGWREMRT